MRKDEFPFSPINVFGRKYRVFKKPKTGGGWFFSTKQEIYIGTEQSPEGIREVLLHEIIEAVLFEGNCRYSRYMSNHKDGVDNDGHRFIMDHDDYENIGRGIKTALEPVLKPLKVGTNSKSKKKKKKKR